MWLIWKTAIYFFVFVVFFEQKTHVQRSKLRVCQAWTATQSRHYIYRLNKVAEPYLHADVFSFCVWTDVSSLTFPASPSCVILFPLIIFALPHYRAPSSYHFLISWDVCHILFAGFKITHILPCDHSSQIPVLTTRNCQSSTLHNMLCQRVHVLVLKLWIFGIRCDLSLELQFTLLLTQTQKNIYLFATWLKTHRRSWFKQSNYMHEQKQNSKFTIFLDSLCLLRKSTCICVLWKFYIFFFWERESDNKGPYCVSYS